MQDCNKCVYYSKKYEHCKSYNIKIVTTKRENCIRYREDIYG